jgi:hypothetical protein
MAMVVIVDREFKKCICLTSGLPDLKWFTTIYIVLSTQYYTNAKSRYNEFLIIWDLHRNIRMKFKFFKLFYLKTCFIYLNVIRTN